MKILLALLLLSSPSIKSLYNSLDPHSLSQYLAFYELYPETEEGQKAKKRALELLRHSSDSPLPQFLFPNLDIQAIVSLITRQPHDPPVKLGKDDLTAIGHLTRHFPNKKLAGANAWTKEEVLALPSEEVDLCRGLLIEQFEDSDNFRSDILQYEASLDLMALQILARLKPGASHLDKLREINRFIFQEMQFRFPPHSLYAKDIDLYTFLPSVLDSRQGVCLGVSILYLCLAQRLNLPLEIITPPGHIYVRYRDGDEITNIETTARGINPPCETYLGINTRKLQQRTLKEVIGMAFVNQASTYWSRGKYNTCVKLYEKALPYLQNDPLIKLFLGLNYLFIGKTKEGEKLLRPLQDYTFDHAVAKETLPSDYFAGRINIEGIKTVFLPVDENRESVLKKQEELQTLLKKYPKFRGGLIQLAVTYLQLGRAKEAKEVLLRYHKLDPEDPTVEYYLSIVSAERRDYLDAWKYLLSAEAVTRRRDHAPRALHALRAKLRTVCPSP